MRQLFYYIALLFTNKIIKIMQTQQVNSTTELIEEHYKSIRINQDLIPKYNARNVQDSDNLYHWAKKIIEAFDIINCLQLNA